MKIEELKNEESGVVTSEYQDAIDTLTEEQQNAAVAYVDGMRAYFKYVRHFDEKQKEAVQFLVQAAFNTVFLEEKYKEDPESAILKAIFGDKFKGEKND